MTKKQRIFVAHYIKTGGANATASARVAGYQAGARVRAHQLLHNPRVIGAIKLLALDLPEARVAAHLDRNKHMANFRRDGYVYVIAYDIAGPCKIGKSTYPKCRIGELQCGCPYKLRLVGLVHHDNAYEAEERAHSHFAEARLNGEWFDVSVTDAVSFITDDVWVAP